MAPRPDRTTSVDDTAAWRPAPDHQTSLLFDVFVLGQRTRVLIAEAMRDAGMRPDEYAAYSVVFEAGPLTQTDVAEHLGMAVTTVADYVRTMVERRHLRKRPHPTDQRAALLSLTPEGIRAHRRASRSFEVAARAMSEQLPPLDEGTAREVLQRLSTSAANALGAIPGRRAG
jgi:DNA-binding MarR family transcriptional regulator